MNTHTCHVHTHMSLCRPLEFQYRKMYLEEKKKLKTESESFKSVKVSDESFKSVKVWSGDVKVRDALGPGQTLGHWCQSTLGHPRHVRH